MKVLIQVHFIFNDIHVLRRGEFKVNSFEYEINPDQAAAESAIRWIKELQNELPDLEIDKVLYNIIDITELVKDSLNKIVEQKWNGPF